MIQFAQPAFLWALAALALPIGIHLLSRKEGKVIRIGSLRHLHETSTQQFRGIRLNEILLLALRCLLLTLFVLMLSGLHWRNERAQRWVLVEEGLDERPDIKTKIDSLVSQGFEAHQWGKGFPAVENKKAHAPADQWQLIHELSVKKLEKAIIFSHARVNDFTGMRAAVPEFVTWVTVPQNADEFIAYAIRKGESTQLRQGYSNESKMYFVTRDESSLPDSVQIESPETISIVIAADRGYGRDQRVVNAALDAISNLLPVHLEITAQAPETLNSPKGNWLIWLSEKETPVVDMSVIKLNESSSEELIEQSGPAQWTINRRLTVDVALKENLTVQLAELIVPRQKYSEPLATHDRRVMPDSLILAGMTSGMSGAEAEEIPPATWLVILFLITLIIERMIAYQRNQ